DRVLRPAEDLCAGAICLSEGELRDGTADLPLDALGAERDLVLAVSLAPFLRAVGVAHGHPHHGDRRMHAADGKHAGDPPAGAHDHLAADVLAEYAVRRADIVAPFRGHRGGLEPQTVRCDRARCLVYDTVRRPS